MPVEEISDRDFDAKVIKAKLPVLVDFWAPWCGPCRLISPHIEALARELDGKLLVAKLNVDGSERVTNLYQVRSIPTLLLFKDGRVLDRKVGARTLNEISSFVKAALQ